MEQGIVCLPIYDSFIVQKQFEEELKQAMMDAYEEQLGAKPSLADFEKLDEDEPLLPAGFKIDYADHYAVDYSQPVKAADFTYLRNKESNSYAATYLSTFFAQF